MPAKRGYTKRRPARRPLKKRSYKKRTTVAKSKYRLQTPRYLELAHFKAKAKTVKFTWAREWIIKPQLHQPASISVRPSFMVQFRCNSICNIGTASTLSQAVIVLANNCWDGTSEIKFVDGNDSLQNTTQPPGYKRYYGDYRHFTVLGSKIDVTAQPTGIDNTTGAEVYLPSQLMVCKTGAKNGVLPAVQTGYAAATPMDMSKLQKLPYKKSAHVALIDGTKSVGGRVSMTYSTKKFEGINDVKDNDQFKGNMGMPAGTAGGGGGPLTVVNPSNPSEGSFFSVIYGTRIDGRAQYSNAQMPATAVAPPVTLRVRMSYIVRLTEPTFVGAGEFA